MDLNFLHYTVHLEFFVLLSLPLLLVQLDLLVKGGRCLGCRYLVTLLLCIIFVKGLKQIPSVEDLTPLFGGLLPLGMLVN